MIEALEPRMHFSGGAIAVGVGAVDQAITTDSGVQQSPSIVADPLNPSHLVVSYMDRSLVDTGYAGIGVAISENGGGTWEHATVPLPAGFSQGASNPTTAFDDQGHVFVSFMAATFQGAQPPLTNPKGSTARTDGFTSNNGIFVSRSDDGGLTWSTAVSVAANHYDGTDPVFFETIPDLAIDTFRTLPGGSANPDFGYQYLTWTRLYPSGDFPGDPTSFGGGAIMLSVSTDGGHTWQLRQQPQVGTGVPVTVIGPNDLYFTGEAPPGLTGQNYSEVTVGPTGEVYVDYYMFGYDFVVRSSDAGRSFTTADPTGGDTVPFNYGPYISSISAADGGGPTNSFRTFPDRLIVADPARPGTLYVIANVETYNSTGADPDYGDIFFARSTDDGATWQSSFTVGGNPAEVLNDDNNGIISTGGPNDVAASQSIPQIAVDAHDDIAVIWYDTRHDPQGHLLDVYGTVSTDGGQSFSANSRLTDQSFDAGAGAFVDPTGAQDFFIGDQVGLTFAGSTVYAAWTDTRSGNQNIEATDFPLSDPPAAEDDRFEPNDTPATATALGSIIQRSLPKLGMQDGDEDWFTFTAAATGTLTVSAATGDPVNQLLVQLYGADGTTLLATGSSTTGITFPSVSGQTYLVRVAPSAVVGTVQYTLNLRSITADLGTVVMAGQSGLVGAGQQAYYTFSAAAAGSIDVTLAPGSSDGALSAEILDPTTFDAEGNPVVLATSAADGSGDQQVTLSALQNQPLLLRVSGSLTAADAFSFVIDNLDVFQTGVSSGLAFPAGDGPSQVVMADVNHDGKPDLIVSDTLASAVSVLLDNGDGTFQSPREFTIGALLPDNSGMLPQLETYKRGLAVADFNGDGNPDIVVTNASSGDVSILLGNGDGTFQPQRRFDATSQPNAVAVGDFNGDGHLDLAVLSSSPGTSQLAILLGRGDGTFAAEQLINTPLQETLGTDDVHVADVNGDGIADLLVTGGVDQKTYVYLGNGDGTFRAPTPVATSQGANVIAGDLDGDGIPDLIVTNVYNDSVTYAPGNGDGTFSDPTSTPAGQTPLAIALADVGSENADGQFVFGALDGVPDLVIADGGIVQTQFAGPPGIVVLPGLSDGGFAGFDVPQTLATGVAPTSLAVGDVNGDGVPDIAYVDTDGVHVIFGKSPTIATNNTPQTARNLGVVVHVVEPTLTITPGHDDAYYSVTVPTEAVAGAGNEVVDLSADFRATAGAGLSMQVFSQSGALLAAGPHVRLVAGQGSTLIVHVFGAIAVDGAVGAGAYTLDIDVLPQVVSVQAESAVSGANAANAGPITSLVVTFQGDRLDPTAAENPSNYTVLWLGAGDRRGKRNARLVPLASQANGVQPVVYDPGANVDVSTGTTYPTAVRQTVTLLFNTPLRPGSYQIVFSSNITTGAFNDQEEQMQATGGMAAAHSVVSVAGGVVSAGDSDVFPRLVPRTRISSGVGSLNGGTPFLGQLPDDLSALLDQRLTRSGDQPGITTALIAQLMQRFLPGLKAAGSRVSPLLLLFLDPVSLNLADPDGQRIDYNLQSGKFSSNVANAFVSVATNVEVVVIPIVPGQYVLDVANVPTTSRGGAVIVGSQVDQTTALTDGLRDGQRQFVLGLPADNTGALPDQIAVATLDHQLIPSDLGIVSDALPVELQPIEEAIATANVPPVTGQVLPESSSDLIQSAPLPPADAPMTAELRSAPTSRPSARESRPHPPAPADDAQGPQPPATPTGEVRRPTSRPTEKSSVPAARSADNKPQNPPLRRDSAPTTRKVVQTATPSRGVAHPVADLAPVARPVARRMALDRRGLGWTVGLLMSGRWLMQTRSRLKLGRKKSRRRDNR